MFSKEIISSPRIFLERFDPSSGMIHSVKEVRFGSFTRNWAAHLSRLLSLATPNALMKFTNGTNGTDSTVYLNASAGNITKGITVGTGSTVGDNNTYSMESKITHGTGAGQLEYGTQTTTHTDFANSIFRYDREFVNNSGASITVQEIGYEINDNANAFTATMGHLMARDIVPGGGETIPNGQALRVRYAFNFSNAINRNFTQYYVASKMGLNQSAFWTDGSTQSMSNGFYVSVFNTQFGTTTPLRVGLTLGTGVDAQSHMALDLSAELNPAAELEAHVLATITNPDSAAGSSAKITRTFLNTTGATINIREVAFKGYHTAYYKYAMLGRKLLASDYPILSDEAATAIWEFKTEYV